MTERLFLIDGSAFAYRSFFAIRGLTDSQGRPTNAVYGFARMLIKLLRENDPAYLAVVFDAPGKTFRDELYPAYKANREETPDDLVAQMPLIDNVVDAFALPLLRIPGVEADDVMGTLARTATNAGIQTVLITGDKDMLQLVNDHVRVYDPNKEADKAWSGIEQVRERFGVAPERVIDALALIGDASDNVPGVTKIGPVAAKKLLSQYESLEGIYDHIDELKGKQREYLENEREQAFLSRRLVTIDTAVPLDVTLEDLRRRPADHDRLIAVFSELEFQSLVEEFLPQPAAEESSEDYRVIEDDTALRAVVDELRAAGAFAVDTETTSTDPLRAELVGISLCSAPGRACYIPVGHRAPGDGNELEGVAAVSLPHQMDREAALAILRPILEDPAIAKIGHNIKFDLEVLARAGIKLAGITLDTMVASYLTDPSRIRHNLSEVSLHYLKRKMVPITDLIGKGPKQITFDRVPIDIACRYACEDADVTWRLGGRLTTLLRERDLEALFKEVELPLIGVLARMEQAGIAIDADLFRSLSGEVRGRLEALEREIFELAGEAFVLNSPRQLQHILFTKLGLKPLRRTKTGYSTDVDVLEQLAKEHELPRKMLEYRVLEKLRGTYIDALPKLVNPETGRIHTSFNQTVAATGRLSSSDPNLQNIPVRTGLGKRIRQGFVAESTGMKLISADYSQVELRILAHLSQDPALREAFAQDADIHSDTAARIFGVMPGLVTPDMRYQAKAVNFGVVYGISAFGLARNLGISRAEAARFIDHYFAQYPKVRDWIDRTIEEAREHGYVTTLLHRRRPVPDLKSRDVSLRRAAERVAINTPVQGSAADIIKLAMIRLDAALQGSRARLLLQVHDELLVECPASEADGTAATMKRIMEEAFPLAAPLKVDIGIGDNWAEIQ
ncbi:MAG TPA: DNA polymerase I [Candidatus Hydrogenedentes bacterium]|jgi:DNA polymerase-1|nr:DNA polymerase I [Candidatus Hydrogenedentota bacterium]